MRSRARHQQEGRNLADAAFDGGKAHQIAVQLFQQGVDLGFGAQGLQVDGLLRLRFDDLCCGGPVHVHARRYRLPFV